MNSGGRPFKLVDWLPSEHGFWVMLGAAQASALLRTRCLSFSVAMAAWVIGAVVFAGSWSHRRVRKSGAAQLTGTAALALSSVPVELAGVLPVASVVSAGLARAVVFVASELVVRAAFARAARGGQRRSLLLCSGSLALPAASAVLLFALGRTAEAGTCAVAAGVCAVFLCSRPTVKQLKPLGLALGGLALVTVVTLAL
jgi:hypothetical protein